MKVKVMSVAIAAVMLATPFSMATTQANVKKVQPAQVLEQLLEGSAANPVWLGSDRILVNHQVDAGSEFVLIDVATKKTSVLIPSDKNAAEATLSSDGKYAAYVNDNGDIFLIEMATMSTSKITTDADPKMELQFAKDSSKLYFLSGDKIDTINAISLADKKQTKLLADKVPYKSELNVASDGKKLIYTVTNPGTTNEADGSFAVDTKNTDPQLFMLNVATGANPVQLTKSSDNKFYSSLLADNSILYVSANSDGAYVVPMLTKISPDGKVAAKLAGSIYVYQGVQAADSSLFILGQNDGGEKGIYKMSADGKVTFVSKVDRSITSILPSADGSKLVATATTASGDKITLVQDGKVVDLTK